MLRLRAPQTSPGSFPAFSLHTKRAFQTSKQQQQNIPFTHKKTLSFKSRQSKLCFPLLSKEQKHSRSSSLRVSHHQQGRGLPHQHLPGREVVPDPRGAACGLTLVPGRTSSVAPFSGDNNNGPGRTQQAGHRRRSYGVRALWRKDTPEGIIGSSTCAHSAVTWG